MVRHLKEDISHWKEKALRAEQGERIVEELERQVLEMRD
jgi:hypothetical protein